MKEKVKKVLKEYFKLAAYTFVSFCVLCFSVGADEKEFIKAFEIFENTFKVTSLLKLTAVVLVIIGIISSVKSLSHEIDINEVSERSIVFFLEIIVNSFYSFVVGICSFLFFYIAFCLYNKLNINSDFILSSTILFFLVGGAEAIFFKILIKNRKSTLLSKY